MGGSDAALAAPVDPRLVELTAAWEQLPDGVRDALLAMVRATRGIA